MAYEDISRHVWGAAKGVSKIEQCAKYKRPLVVHGTDSLLGIERFTSLRELELIGGDFDDLHRIAGLQSLRSLKIVCAKIKDLTPLAGLTELEDLEINFTFVEDLSPIDGLKNLGWLKLFGNPLDAKSFHEVLGRKRTTEVERWGRPCIVETSSEDEWALGRKLFETGVGLVWGTVPGTAPTLVRPGNGGFASLIEFLQLPDAGVQMIVDAPEPAKWPSVKNVGTLFQKDVEQSHERFSLMWQSGRPIDAAGWIHAATWLPEEEKQRFLRFVARFPGEIFSRDHDTRMRWERVRSHTPLPDWFTQMRTNALAGVRPTQRELQVRIDKFDTRAATRSGGWYTLGLIGFSNSDLRALFHDELHLFPIGEIWEPSEYGHSTLAINLRDPNDLAIYEVDPIYAEAGSVAVTPVFASYGALLDRITALRTADGLITEAIALVENVAKPPAKKATKKPSKATTKKNAKKKAKKKAST
jgi:hypothetical protein